MSTTSKYFWSAWIFVLLSLSCLNTNILFGQCANFTGSQSQNPIAGVYYAGTVVEYCLDVSLWDGDFYDPSGLGAEYIHGVQPINIGSGWMPLSATSGTTSPTVCSSSAGGVNWSWTNHPTLGWGWFFEAPLNFNPLDNDPSNNHGDSNTVNASCDWTFCFEMETVACPPGVDGLSLDLQIDVYSDGESGAWTSTNCSADPVYTGPSAMLVCEEPCFNPILELSADALDGLDICTGAELDLGSEVDLLMSSIPPGATSISYYWEGPPASFWDSTEENPTIVNPVPGEYSVSVDVDGCASQDTYDIIVNILASPNISWSSNSVCSNVQPVLLEPAPGAETGGQWSGEGVSDMGDGTAMFDPTAVSGMSSQVTYELVGTSCDASNTQAINVLSAPGEPSPEVVDPICADETNLPTLIASPDVPENFVRWYADSALDIADFIEESNSIPFPDFIDVSTPGQYSVWVQTANSTGCFSDALEVIINIVDCSCPAILNSFDEYVVCDGEELLIPVDVQSPELGSLTWLYPDGTTVEEIDATYTFSLVDPCGELQELNYELYCANTDETETGTIEVMVHPNLDDDSVVIAQIEMDDCPLISVTSNCPQFDVSLDAGGGALPGLEYQISSDETGELMVSISQMDAGTMCTSHDIFYAYSCEIPTIKVPNAFSPNADGFNDCFQLLGADLSQAEIRIFNRWGEEVFASNDPLFCWNGTHNGEMAGVGVYVYETFFTYEDGREDSYKGNITLIR